MKRILLSYALVFFGLNVFAQDVVIFEKGDKFGVKSADSKKTIVKAEYDYIYKLNDRHLLVEKARKIGIITINGAVVFPPLYDDVQNFGDDSFLVMSNNRYGVINRFNRIIVPLEYTGVEQFGDYLYILHSRNKRGLLNRFGNIVLHPNYDDITGLPDNLLLVKSGNNVGLVDETGNVIINPDKYSLLEKLGTLHLYKVRFGNKWGVIDLNGKTVADPVLDEISYSGDKAYITVKKDGKYGFIINKQYLPARYDKIVFTQDELGVIAVREGRLNGFITTSGVVVSPVYENISRFSPKGWAFVEKRGKLMFVDINGKERSLQDVAGNGG